VKQHVVISRDIIMDETELWNGKSEFETHISCILEESINTKQNITTNSSLPGTRRV